MIWAVLVLVAVVLAVHWWEYQADVQEYTFAQPARLDRRDELRAVLSEKTPLAVEIGALPWRPTVAEGAGWVAMVGDERAAMPVGDWLKSEPRSELVNGGDLATQMDLVTGLADLDAARRWWWMPGVRDATLGILPKGGVRGLTWITAERQWIGCSHGGPLTLWLVHSRYRRYLPSGSGDVNPWALTVTEAPWIGRVQYIEVVVRPGWAFGLPAHWGFAVKGDDAGESWWWTASQHSVVSWFLTAPPTDGDVGELENFAVPEESEVVSE